MSRPASHAADAGPAGLSVPARDASRAGRRRAGRAASAHPGAAGCAVVAAASLTCLLLGGCGGAGNPGTSSGRAVRLLPPHPGPAASRGCAALARMLPERLAGHARVAVRPTSPLTAAWGSPPIGLRCGVALPGALTQAAGLTVVNGVAWFAEPAGSATPSRFTEVGREAYAELTVPARYTPAVTILVPISNALARALPAKSGGRI